MRPFNRGLTGSIARIAAAAGCGVYIFHFWDGYRLDDYFKSFATLWFPAQVVSLEIIGALILRKNGSHGLPAWLSWFPSALLLSFTLLGPPLVENKTDPQFTLAAFYLSALSIHGVSLFSGLYSMIDLPKGFSWRLALALSAIYFLIAPWYTLNQFTDGDEPHHLIVTVSIWEDHDLDFTNNYEDRNYYSSFYGGHLNPKGYQGRIVRTFHGLAYPIFIIPGWAIAGWMGVIAQMCVVSAFFIVNLLRLCVEIGLPKRVSYLSALAAAFSIPIINYTVIPTPDILACLIVTYAIRLVLRSGSVKTDIASLAAIFSLPILQIRYIPMALAMATLPAYRIAKSNRKLAAGVLSAFIAAVFVVDVFVFDNTFQNRALPILITLGKTLGSRLSPQGLGEFTLWVPSYWGHFWDQEYGLIPYAPIYLFFLPGVAAVYRKSRIAAIYLLWVFIFYFVTLNTVKPDQWFAGRNPHQRYLMVALPVLCVFMAGGLSLVKNRITACLAGSAALLSFASTFLLTLYPRLRYPHNDAVGEIFNIIASWTGVSVYRFFPTFIWDRWTTPRDYHIAAVYTLVWIFFAFYVYRSKSADTRLRPVVHFIAWPAVFLLILSGSVYAADSLWPHRRIEVEIGGNPSGIAYFDRNTGDTWWVLRAPGDTIEKKIVLGGGGATLTFVGGAYTNTGEPPRMEIAIDGKVESVMELPVNPPGSGSYRKFELPFSFDSSYGPHTLRLRLVNGYPLGHEKSVNFYLNYILVSSG